MDKDKDNLPRETNNDETARDAAESTLETAASLEKRVSSSKDLPTHLVHELRNPLAAIRGFAQLIPGADPRRLASYAASIVREIDRIDDFLESLSDRHSREKKRD